MEIQRLKYTHEDIEIITSATGLTTYNGVYDIYKGASLRNRVVCRADVVYVFNKFMSPDVAKMCRDALLRIASGDQSDPELFSSFMLTLAKEDKLFANSLNLMFGLCPTNVSFGGYIACTFANIINDEVEMYRRFFRGSDPMVVCYSDGYIYFSVVDENVIPELPVSIDVEMVSYAKNWRGNFKVGGELYTAFSV